MDKQTSGYHCMYKNCGKRTSSDKTEILKFHRVPKDETMCRRWVQACGQEELLNVIPVCDFYQKFRACSMHFENCMYNYPFEKSRLLPTAVPIKCEALQVQDHTDFVSVPSQAKPIPSKRITVLQDITISAASNTRTPSTVECSEVQQPFHSSVETQTTKCISSHSPRKLKLKKKIVVLQAENKKLKEKLEKVVEPSEESFFQLAEKYMTPEIARFIRAQVNLTKANKFGKRYTEELKRFALTIYFLGPRCYTYLQTMFLLPSKRSLSLFVEKIKFSPGHNKILFDILKLKVQHMNPQDRFCTICIDEMSIKTNVFYNYAFDEVIGLEDNGSSEVKLFDWFMGIITK